SGFLLSPPAIAKTPSSSRRRGKSDGAGWGPLLVEARMISGIEALTFDVGGQDRRPSGTGRPEAPRGAVDALLAGLAGAIRVDRCREFGHEGLVYRGATQAAGGTTTLQAGCSSPRGPRRSSRAYFTMRFPSPRFHPCVTTPQSWGERISVGSFDTMNAGI